MANINTNNNDCIFCKIAAGEIPHNQVYSDKDIVAFLDIQPASKKGGHTLVIPKKHYETIADIPENLLAKIMSVVKKISVVLMKEADGVNVVQNNKKAAGQFVPHVHFHVIPRHEGDSIRIEKWESFKYAEGEAEKIADKIRAELKK